MGSRVGPAPDINACDADFTADGHRVRFGLAAVKGVGDKAVAAILVARREAKRFKDLFHFCRQVDLRRRPTRGHRRGPGQVRGFDALHGPQNRTTMLDALEPAMQAGQRAPPPPRVQQVTFFDSMLSNSNSAPARPPPIRPSQQAREPFRERAHFRGRGCFRGQERVAPGGYALVQP